MKKYFLFITATLLIIVSFNLKSLAQIKNPTKFTYTVSKKENGNYELLISVALEANWHIYSQNPGTGPVPTSIVFDKNPLIKLQGKPKEEGDKIVKFDEAFKTNLSFYNNHLVLKQSISKKGKAKTLLNGYVQFMVCDDSRCLPPKKENFSVSIQ